MRKVLAFCLVALTAVCLFAGGREMKFRNPKGNVVADAVPGDEIEIELVENGTTGYLWYADYDAKLCKVEIDHEGPKADKAGLAGVPGEADVEIEPLSNGPIAVVLEYKRAWEKGIKPIKRVCVLLNGAKEPQEKENEGMKKIDDLHSQAGYFIPRLVTASEMIDDLLSQAGYFFLATVDGDQPKLRPLGAHFIADGKVIFGVGDFKNVYKQLAKNPKTEIVAMIDGKGKWLRYTGRAVFAEEADRLRYTEMTFERIPGLRDIYNEKTGHKLMCFWLEDATAEVINMMPPGEKIEL